MIEDGKCYEENKIAKGKRECWGSCFKWGVHGRPQLWEIGDNIYKIGALSISELSVQTERKNKCKGPQAEFLSWGVFKNSNEMSMLGLVE